MTGPRTQVEVTLLRARYAADVCECGHERRHHYGPKGSTDPCPLPGCVCPGYAWRDRPRKGKP